MRSQVEPKCYMMTYPSVLRSPSVLRVWAAIPSEYMALSQTFSVTAYLHLVVIGPLTTKWHSMTVDISPLSIQLDSLCEDAKRRGFSWVLWIKRQQRIVLLSMLSTYLIRFNKFMIDFLGLIVFDSGWWKKLACFLLASLSTRLFHQVSPLLRRWQWVSIRRLRTWHGT